MDSSAPVILTVGHSTRPVDVFIPLLLAHGVTLLVDVRTIPRSRHNPQFNADTLPAVLAGAGIDYLHMKGLGGLRHPLHLSPNTGWQNSSFRGFADYMLTAEFTGALDRLVELAQQSRVAVMCAEAVPWRCHRSLIADALTVRGVEVEHIFSPSRRERHHLTPFARVDGLTVTYPGEGEEQGP